MRRAKSGTAVLLLSLWLLAIPEPRVAADVTSGDVIDRTNWEKAEGLVPDNVLNWLKRGDFTMQVVELNYDLQDYLPPIVRKSMKANLGKYDVDENGLMVDLQTGRLPEFIEGIPFPDIDPKAPKAGEKLMYNKFYHVYSQGNMDGPFGTRWVGRQSGLEREVIGNFKQFILDGYPGAREGIEGISQVR